MNEDADFIRAILAQPDDDLLRLAYADWLEERQDRRGAYLRLLCQVSGTSPLTEVELLPALELLEELRAGVEPEWVGLMHRGRALPVPEHLRGRLAEGEATAARRYPSQRNPPCNEAEVSTFLRQYARKGCNDRSYSRKIEKKVQRMKPEEFDRLLHGEEE